MVITQSSEIEINSNVVNSSSPVLDENEILDNILCTFVSNYIELLAAVEHLYKILENNAKVNTYNLFQIFLVNILIISDPSCSN